MSRIGEGAIATLGDEVSAYEMSNVIVDTIWLEVNQKSVIFDATLLSLS